MKLKLFTILSLGFLMLSCDFSSDTKYRIVTDGTKYKLEENWHNYGKWEAVGDEDYSDYKQARRIMLRWIQVEEDAKAKTRVSERDKTSWHEVKIHKPKFEPTPIELNFITRAPTPSPSPSVIIGSSWIELVTPTATP